MRAPTASGPPNTGIPPLRSPPAAGTPSTSGPPTPGTPGTLLSATRRSPSPHTSEPPTARNSLHLWVHLAAPDPIASQTPVLGPQTPPFSWDRLLPRPGTPFCFRGPRAWTTAPLSLGDPRLGMLPSGRLRGRSCVGTGSCPGEGAGGCGRREDSSSRGRSAGRRTPDPAPAQRATGSGVCFKVAQAPSAPTWTWKWKLGFGKFCGQEAPGHGLTPFVYGGGRCLGARVCRLLAPRRCLGRLCRGWVAAGHC